MNLYFYVLKYASVSHTWNGWYHEVVQSIYKQNQDVIAECLIARSTRDFGLVSCERRD